MRKRYALLTLSQRNPQKSDEFPSPRDSIVDLRYLLLLLFGWTTCWAFSRITGYDLRRVYAQVNSVWCLNSKLWIVQSNVWQTHRDVFNWVLEQPWPGEVSLDYLNGNISNNGWIQIVIRDGDCWLPCVVAHYMLYVFFRLQGSCGNSCYLITIYFDMFSE